MRLLHGAFASKVCSFVIHITLSLPCYAGQFPFHINQDKLSDIVASNLNEPIKKEHTIHRKSKHFYTLGPDLKINTADDQRIRFWGINLSPPMTFPQNKSDAERLALRLKKLGFNLVRLHAIDMMPTKPYMSLLAKTDQPYPVLNKKNLKSLKMLVESLKQHGIYVDLVLRLGYRFSPDKDCISINKQYGCVPDPARITNKYNKISLVSSLGKPLGLFNREMIELQKRYFSLILSHFKDDPVLAMVEIANENSLIEIFSEDDKRIPPLYAEELDDLWKKWLSIKYSHISKLNSSWKSRESSSSKIELLLNNNFEKVLAGVPVSWSLMQWPLNGIKTWGNWEVTKDQVLKIDVDRIPEKYWYMFITQADQKVDEGEVYSVTIRARAVPTRKIQIGVNAEVNGKAVNANRYKQILTIGEDYRDYKICFKSTVSSNNARLTILPIQPGSLPGALWVENISFSRAGLVKAATMVTDIASVSRPVLKNDQACPESRAKEEDYLKFLAHTEKQYYKEIVSYLKNDLTIKVPITGTQANYGGLLGNKIVSDVVDYTDVHFYWDHTKTKNRDIKNWWMQNVSMVENPESGLFQTIASTRVHDMPFTISEYGLNLANEYAHEGYVLGAAYGAYQDIDAIMVFDYNAGGSGTDSRKRMQPDKLTSWYNILGDTRSEILMPVAAKIFREGNLSGQTEDYIIAVNNEMRHDPVLNGWSIRDINKVITDKKYAKNNTVFNLSGYLKYQFSLVHINGNSEPFQKKITAISDRSHSKNDKINISYEKNDKPYIKVEMPSINVVTGYVETPVDIGNIQIVSQNKTDAFCTISVSSIDGKPVNEADSLLIRAVGAGKNRNTDIVKTKNGYRICVPDKNRECKYPFFHPAAGEFVTDSCSLHVTVKGDYDRLTLETLDEQGVMVKTRTSIRKSGVLSIYLDDPAVHSLWYTLKLQ